jgi:hypothetical protein
MRPPGPFFRKKQVVLMDPDGIVAVNVQAAPPTGQRALPNISISAAIAQPARMQYPSASARDNRCSAAEGYQETLMAEKKAPSKLASAKGTQKSDKSTKQAAKKAAARPGPRGQTGRGKRRARQDRRHAGTVSFHG